MLKITELRVAQARAARQRAARYTAHFRGGAEEFRKQAARASSSEMRAALLRLASRYEALSKLGDDREGVGETEPNSFLDQERPETSSIANGDKGFETGAHSRMAQAEAQIKRVQAFSQSLSNDDRDLALRARIALSQTLYHNTLEMSRETRDIINRTMSASPGGGSGPSKIHSPMTMDELKALLNTTEECMARAVSAEHQAARYLDHDKSQIEEFKRQADRATSPEVRESLLRIAASYQRLVRAAGGVKSPRSEPLGDDQQKTRNAAGCEEGVLSQRGDEDPIAQARRHVAEAQDHIARQEALVARLSGDARHAALAAEAREILATLKQTLSLAREHLEMELKK